MRKADREITGLADILEVLERCPVLRIGFRGDGYPYVVPVSFGFEAVDGQVALYFHGAKEGFKHTLIEQDNRVCVEADLFHRYVQTGHGITADYESVIGFGIIEKVEDDDAVHGLELMLQHCDVKNYPAAHCIALGVTQVYRITLDRISGKRRFPTA